MNPPMRRAVLVAAILTSCAACSDTPADTVVTPSTVSVTTTTAATSKATTALAEPAEETDTTPDEACAQVEEYRVALEEFSGQPVTTQESIESTVDMFRQDAANRGLPDHALDAAIAMVRNCL